MIGSAVTGCDAMSVNMSSIIWGCYPSGGSKKTYKTLARYLPSRCRYPGTTID